MSQNICPKCKQPVQEKDIRCTNCNMRLKVVCPNCNSVNIFGAENCDNCGTALIKYCPSCHSANFPNAKECRKCHSSFEVKSSNFDELNQTNNLPIENVENVKNVEIEEPIQTKNIVETVENQEEQAPIEENIPTQEEIITKTKSETPEITEEESIEQATNEIDNVQEENIEEITENIETYSPEETQEPLAEQEEIKNTEEETDNTEDNIINVQEEEIEQIPQESYNEEYIEPYQPKEEEIEQIVYFDDQKTLLEQLENIMQTANNAVVTAVCGEEGVGKSTVIKSFADGLAEQGIIPIASEGSELIKVSPFGCIRDALLKLLTLPDLHPDINSFYSEETKSLFVQNFETLSDLEINEFMNFLYPAQQGNFEDIYIRKEATVELLEKIIISITSKNPAVFIIDDFDIIDSASFEFINNLVKKGIINNQVKLFVTYRENKSAKLYFDNEFEHQDIFSTLYLNRLNEEETSNLIKSFANAPTIPTTVNYTINEKGGGNRFFTEQFLSLLFDVGYMYIDAGMMKFKEDEPIPFLPKNISEVIQLRFDSLQVSALKDSLLTASILGYKFDKTAFAAVVDITPEQADELLQKLTDLMFIQPVSDYEYSFKNLTTWAVIFEFAQNDQRFKIICKKAYYIFGKYALSNPSLKAIVAKYRDEAETVMQSWRDTAAVCAYLGDAEMFTTALEELLISSGYNKDTTELTDEQTDIMEKFGKLAYESQPEKAVEYLTAPIIAAKDSNNIPKVIDLCSYLIKACYLTSDYSGVIEATDLILATANSQLSLLDNALIKSKKLHALFKTGNCEEGINLANNEIIPPLEEELSKQNDQEAVDALFSAWFDTYLNLINLYALQGNAKAVEIAENTAEIMQMNNIDNPEYTVRLNIAKAFALTVVGRIYDSATVLKATETIPEYNNKEYIARRNLVYAMNLIFSETTQNLKEQLYDFAKYANDNNDIFGKHIFKMMFAWMIYDAGNYDKASIIFNDELTYFAKIKTVTGALISWMFIAKSTLATEGAESAENIALKALEVAQNPKFSQYHAAIYLQKLLAEINLIKGDNDAAKMYIEKGMLTAKQFGLELAQVELYRTYTKFMEQEMLQDNKKAEFAEKADKIYKAAISASQKLRVPHLTALIQKEHQTLIDYCSQNNVTI